MTAIYFHKLFIYKMEDWQMEKKEQVVTPETTATGLVDNIDALVAKMAEVREAQRIFSTYTQ